MTAVNILEDMSDTQQLILQIIEKAHSEMDQIQADILRLAYMVEKLYVMHYHVVPPRETN